MLPPHPNKPDEIYAWVNSLKLNNRNGNASRDDDRDRRYSSRESRDRRDSRDNYYRRSSRSRSRSRSPTPRKIRARRTRSRSRSSRSPSRRRHSHRSRSPSPRRSTSRRSSTSGGGPRHSSSNYINRNSSRSSRSRSHSPKEYHRAGSKCSRYFDSSTTSSSSGNSSSNNKRPSSPGQGHQSSRDREPPPYRRYSTSSPREEGADRSSNNRNKDRLHFVPNCRVERHNSNPTRASNESYRKGEHLHRNDQFKKPIPPNPTTKIMSKDLKSQVPGPLLNPGEAECALEFLDTADELVDEPAWIRSLPDEPYYSRQPNGEMIATAKLLRICETFEDKLVNIPNSLRTEAEELGKAKLDQLIAKEEEEAFKANQSSSESEDDDDSDSSDSSDSLSDDDEEDEIEKKNPKPKRLTRNDKAQKELQRRKLHPRRLHTELWHNDPGLMNDGPVCRCSAKSRRFGIRHGFYPGESEIPPCDPFSNNNTRLYQYKMIIKPLKNFIFDKPTVIPYDNHLYEFEGFSLLSHHKMDLTQLPPCSVIRFNIRYDIRLEEEKLHESYCIKELDLFQKYLFHEVLELVDLKFTSEEAKTCPSFHILPRFTRKLPDNGKEVLSMSRILQYLLKSNQLIFEEENLKDFYTIHQKEWQNFVDNYKQSIVTKWGMKPCALRVDQIDRNIDEQVEQSSEEDGIPFPVIVHFGIRPPQLSYAGNSEYQKAWREYVKYRHLLSNMPKPTAEHKRKLVAEEYRLQEMRTKSSMKRDVTVEVSAKGFRATGLCCDIIQHAMMTPVLIAHLRFHRSLINLENRLCYKFKSSYILQLALTHPSYRENFGTNPDHARNALTNCGLRQPEYGDRTIHYNATRKRGINTLINIMAKFGEQEEKASEIAHNERLEFLGDAVVEFLASIHLFFLFPDLEEGGLATYRAAIVQNQHLANLAKILGLEHFMLYAHGSDLCHDSELRHAMANCFEALMGAIFLDGGIEAADKVFGSTLFDDDSHLLNLWMNFPKHPLQSLMPQGDRELVKKYEVLQKLTQFEDLIGVKFNHIRLLARAFTDRSLGYTLLTRGSNQRLEFLGDTVLQLISSEYLYRFFPDHHEGHLSLLRSSLVNNHTQALVCDELGMPDFAMRSDPKAELKSKDRADLLEAFLGSLYVDRGIPYCTTFCNVLFIPRLKDSILTQKWNDPKSKLQQCCLTLRRVEGGEPDIPVYKVIECQGPTNTRIYLVAVYFRFERLATGAGHSIQEAEMNAATSALTNCVHLFPQLHHQKRVIDKTTKKCRRKDGNKYHNPTSNNSKKTDGNGKNCSNNTKVIYGSKKLKSKEPSSSSVVIKIETENGKGQVE